MSDSQRGPVRFIFWVIFPIAALGAGIYFWQQKVPQRVDRYVLQMAHPNAKVATEGWLELRELYFTKWEAYDLVLARATDDTPIHFLVEKEKFPAPGKPVWMGFWANSKPIYYKTDQVYCRTVGDAIRAMIYNDRTGSGKPKWRTDYAGDWDAWWQANKGYYGVME